MGAVDDTDGKDNADVGEGEDFSSLLPMRELTSKGSLGLEGALLSRSLSPRRENCNAF